MPNVCAKSAKDNASHRGSGLRRSPFGQWLDRNRSFAMELAFLTRLAAPRFIDHITPLALPTHEQLTWFLEYFDGDTNKRSLVRSILGKEFPDRVKTGDTRRRDGGLMAHLSLRLLAISYLRLEAGTKVVGRTDPSTSLRHFYIALCFDHNTQLTIAQVTRDDDELHPGYHPDSPWLRDFIGRVGLLLANVKLGKQRGVPIERILLPQGSISRDGIALKVPAIPVTSGKQNITQSPPHDLLIDQTIREALRKLQQDEIGRTGGFGFGPRRSPPAILFSSAPTPPVEHVVRLSRSEDAMQRQVLIRYLRRWLSKGNNEALSRLGGDQRQDTQGSGYLDWAADGFLGLGWS